MDWLGCFESFMTMLLILYQRGVLEQASVVEGEIQCCAGADAGAEE